MKIIKCPLCNYSKSKILYSDNTSTLYNCNYCNSNYKIFKSINNDIYNTNYFNEQYKSKYGVDYLSDIDNIRNYSLRRIKILKKLFQKKEDLNLLDVGSAFGVFVDTANKNGIKSVGCEISEYARNKSKELFSIETLNNFLDIENHNFDIITMWFMLEHIENPDIYIRKAYRLLNKDGILALGLPNGYGLFRRFNKNEYFKKRPFEHYFEPSMKGIRILLKNNGFKIVYKEYFGLHPDRIGLPKNLFTINLQKLLKLGDTFEVYARKIDK